MHGKRAKKEECQSTAVVIYGSIFPAVRLSFLYKPEMVNLRWTQSFTSSYV